MADEFKTSQMLSKDADPINIKRKDEVFLESVDVLGTEGVTNQQAGRKPGRGSKRLSQVEAETGLMYRSDTKPRVIAGSTVFAIVKMLKGRRVCYRVFSVESMNPPAQEFIQAQVPTLLQSSHSSMSTSTSRCATQQRKLDIIM